MIKITTFILGLFISAQAFTQCNTIIQPSNIIMNNEIGLCGTFVDYQVPQVIDTCSSVGFFEDFESGSTGWTFGVYNTLNNWVVQSVSGAGTMLNSNMIGVPHSGNYSFGGKEYSYIQSPEFSTIGGGSLSFDFFVNNEPAVHDQEIVEISYDGGITWTQVIGNQLPNNDFDVQFATIPVSDVNGSINTKVRFVYNTVDACCGAQDGFFIDNVRFEKNTSVQLISGLGSGEFFPIGTTIEVYEVTFENNIDTVSFYVTVNSTYHETQNISICYGEVLEIGNNTYTTSGTYYYTFTTAMGCDSILTTILTVKNSIDSTLFVDDRLIVANENGANYQWISCTTMNTPIVGANFREFIANENGNYAVIITKDGCTKTSSSVNVTSVGVDDVMKNNLVNVYPNPFTDMLTINLETFNNQTTISVYNINGQEIVYVNKINSLQTKLDLSNYSKGIYFVKINNNDNQQTLKLIKE